MAPYCAIPRDYLSDTPLLRAMGFLVSQHGQLGAIPPPPFLSVSPLECMRSGGAIPPPPKGYLSDTCAIPYENKANGCDTPLCDTISEGYCAIWGVSRIGPLRLGTVWRQDLAILSPEGSRDGTFQLRMLRIVITTAVLKHDGSKRHMVLITEGSLGRNMFLLLLL